jgi:hypothetical protein
LSSRSFPGLPRYGESAKVFLALKGGRAVAVLGEEGVVDLIRVSGYYTLVSMVLNVAEIPLPAGVASTSARAVLSWR